jgi:hypothetical protein
MNYLEARSKIKSGDLLAWSHRGWGTWHDIKIQAVRFFTQSEYSHVATAWCVGDRVFVIEAVQPLVRIYPLSKLGEFYWLPLNCNWNDKALDYALSKVGESYSQMQAITAFFKTLEKEDSLWECAELAARVSALAGFDLGTVYTPSKVVQRALEQGAVTHLITSKTST